MTNYKSGTQLEYAVKKLFEEKGWSVVRGAGSKGEVDGFKVDLVASKRGRKYADDIYIVLLQAKRRTI